MTKGPLNGVTVLELSVMVASPVAGRLLADMGARVIKIERAEGDGWRLVGLQHHPNVFKPEANPIFDIFNSGKEMLSIDLRSEEGKKVFDELLDKVDIFLTNMKLSSLKKMGIHYEDVCPKHPGLIYGIGLGFGENGPDKDTPAYDTTAFWARSGFLTDMAVIGQDGHYLPLEAPSSVGDTFSGTTMAMELCAALYRKKVTGKGDVVRSSLYHNAVFSMQAMMIQAEKPYGHPYPKDRIDHGCTYRAFKCADGEYIYIARGIASETLRKELIAFGEDPDSFDAEYYKGTNRAKNVELYNLCCRHFIEKPAAEWVNIMKKLGVAGTVMGHFYKLAEDEQAWANGYVEKIKYDNGFESVVATTSVEMDSCEKAPISQAHTIGQDTREVLESFGYSKEYIDGLFEKNVVK